MAGADRAPSANPHGKARMKRWTLLPLVLAASACAVPWLMSHLPALGLALQRGFSLVCHQHADRSFVNVRRRRRRLLPLSGNLHRRVGRPSDSPPAPSRFANLLTALAVNAIDWAAELAGLHGNWMFTRFALGPMLGLAAAMLAANSQPESPSAGTSPIWRV